MWGLTEDKNGWWDGGKILDPKKERSTIARSVLLKMVPNCRCEVTSKLFSESVAARHGNVSPNPSKKRNQRK